MRTAQWQDRVKISTEIHHGDPCIKSTRIPVATIVGCLADGMGFKEVQEAYPQLAEVDVKAVLAYTANFLHKEVSIW
jgi:uncharacterized protein (DUF433 family)